MAVNPQGGLERFVVGGPVPQPAQPQSMGGPISVIGQAFQPNPSAPETPEQLSVAGQQPHAFQGATSPPLGQSLMQNSPQFQMQSPQQLQQMQQQQQMQAQQMLQMLLQAFLGGGMGMGMGTQTQAQSPVANPGQFRLQ